MPTKLILFILLFTTACKKYLTVPLPNDRIIGSSAFSNNDSAAAVVSNILFRLSSAQPFQGNTSIGYYTGLYTDEQQNTSLNNKTNQAFYTNTLTGAIAVGTWQDLYKQLYAANQAIEGLGPTHLSMRQQLLGEALFLRAFMHFYLTNCYGDIPIAITSNYNTNNRLARSPQIEVYQQIIKDLLLAQTLLDDHYRNAKGTDTTDRGRPCKMSATALLARTYCYTGDWANAELQAGIIIANNNLYQLPDPARTFLSNSPEMIWGLSPQNTYQNTVRDTWAYIITPGLTPAQSGIDCSLDTTLVHAFGPGDTRLANWIGYSDLPAADTTPAKRFYFSWKYKTKIAPTLPLEYHSILRLAEIYLIRAEARAHQDRITGAAEDLDMVRTRAAQSGTTAANQPDMLAAIRNERRLELFAEDGHRFFDLRRTGYLDAVMDIAAPKKGAVWKTFRQWWPIPPQDIAINPNLIQTPGYE